MADDEREDAGNPGGPGGSDDNPRTPGRRPSSGGGGGFGDRGRGRPGGGFNRDRGFSRGGPGGRPAGAGGRPPSPGGGFNRDRGFSGDRRPFGGGGSSQDRPFRGGDRSGGTAGAFGRERQGGGDDRQRERPWSDRPPRDRGDDRDRGGSGGFARDDRQGRGSFGDSGGRPSGDRPFRERPQGDRPHGDRPQRPYGDRPQRPFGDRPYGDRPQRPFGDRPYGDRPQRPFGERPSRPFEDRQDRPGGRFGGGQREGFSGNRGGGGRPLGAPPAGRGWQNRDNPTDRDERFDSGDRPDRDERPDRDRGDSGDDRSSYRSGPRIGGRAPFRPDQRDDRVGRGSWQDRDERGRDRDDAGSGEGFASPVLLAEDEELVAGRRPVAEAFSARRPAKRLLVVPERRQALEQLVLHATALRIPVVEVEGGTLTSVSGFDGHQGIALVVEPRRWASLDDVLARAAERGEPPLILVLDSLEDPQNVGTLLRTAEANGVHGVVFPTRRSAPISPAAIKTSAGATEHLLLVPLDDLAGGLVDLHSRGLRVVGADEEAQLSYRDADLRGPLAIVVGSEGTGISGVVHRRLDLAVRIPMRGKVASLNAAVAGSVLLFEAAYQRGTPETDRRALANSQAAGLLAAPAAADATAADAAAPEDAVEADAASPKPKRGRKVNANAAGASPSADTGAEASLDAAAEPSPGAAADLESGAQPDVKAAKPKRQREAKPEPEPGDSASASAEASKAEGQAAAKLKRTKRAKAEPPPERATDDLLP